MKNIVYMLLFVAMTIDVANSNPLKTNDPEYVQLIAMGYDVSESSSGSIISRNDTAMFVIKTDKVLFLARYFNLDPKKVSSEELKALQLINKLDARFGVAYAHRKSIAARLFLATHSHYNFSFIP